MGCVTVLRPWTPDLVSLDLLLSVVELGSVGKAAAAHGISTPSASARLTRLERQLGVPVLVRSARGTTPTAAGEAIVAWASSVIDAAHAMTDGVQTLRANQGARLRIAASLTIAEYLLPQWLLAFRRAHPEVEMVASVANTRAVSEDVRSGAVDLGFIESPEPPEGLTERAVGTDRLALVASPDFIRDLDGAEISAEILLGLPILLREAGSGTRDTFLLALSQALGRNPVLPLAVALGSTATILATARAGGGIGVVSRRAVTSDLSSGALQELEVDNLRPRRQFRAIWLGRHPSALARDFLEHASCPDRRATNKGL